MLGNCIIRNPRGSSGNLDKGAICESLLFFDRVHLIIDMGTLYALVKADFLDSLIALLEAGYITANYSPQAPVLHTDTKNGLKEHFFTVVKISGDQKKPKMRNPDLLEQALTRISDDKVKAQAYYRRLAKLISFEDIADHGVPELGKKDICDPLIAREVARMALREKGIPENEITFTYVNALPLDGFKFAITTDIDFDHLRQYVPDDDKSTFNQNTILPMISDARFDIGLAANYNAALVGNDKSKDLTQLILKRSIGSLFSPEDSLRSIYDFISVDTPSVRDVINSNERTVAEFIILLEKSNAFKNWLKVQNPTGDLVKEMLREKAQAGWLSKTPMKLARFGIFTAAGAIADTLSPGAGVLAGAADTFLLDKIAKHWRPHFFVENNLKRFLGPQPG